MNQPKKPYYPIFLDLNERPCLVVGGGRVAWRKIAGLLECGARVTVVAPRVVDVIVEKAREGELTLWPREFREDDLEGFFLVYAATDQSAVNAGVLDQARRRRLLAAAVDASWRQGDFLTPARFRRDGVTVAVSSDGQSCCRSRDLKNEIKELLKGAGSEK